MQIAHSFVEIKRKINQEQEKNEKKSCLNVFAAAPPGQPVRRGAKRLGRRRSRCLRRFYVQRAAAHAAALRLTAAALLRFTVRVKNLCKQMQISTFSAFGKSVETTVEGPLEEQTGRNAGKNTVTYEARYLRALLLNVMHY